MVAFTRLTPEGIFNEWARQAGIMRGLVDDWNRDRTAHDALCKKERPWWCVIVVSMLALFILPPVIVNRSAFFRPRSAPLLALILTPGAVGLSALGRLGHLLSEERKLLRMSPVFSSEEVGDDHDIYQVWERFLVEQPSKPLAFESRGTEDRLSALSAEMKARIFSSLDVGSLARLERVSEDMKSHASGLWKGKVRERFPTDYETLSQQQEVDWKGEFRKLSKWPGVALSSFESFSGGCSVWKVVHRDGRTVRGVFSPRTPMNAALEEMRAALGEGWDLTESCFLNYKMEFSQPAAPDTGRYPDRRTVASLDDVLHSLWAAAHHA